MTLINLDSLWHHFEIVYKDFLALHIKIRLKNPPRWTIFSTIGDLSFNYFSSIFFFLILSLSFIFFLCFFFLKMGQPRPLFHLFSSFQTYITIFQQKNLKKCPFSIRCHDSNSWPLEHESPLITTRPGVPPVSMLLLSLTFIASIGLLYKTKIPSSYETVFFCILVFLSVAVAIIWTCMVKWSVNWPSTSTIWVQTPQFFVGNCWKRKIGRDWPIF